jgi:hypothetical protein
LVLAGDRVEYFWDLLQFEVVTLSVTDHDGLDQTVKVLRLGCESANGTVR